MVYSQRGFEAGQEYEMMVSGIIEKITYLLIIIIEIFLPFRAINIVKYTN